MECFITNKLLFLPSEGMPWAEGTAMPEGIFDNDINYFSLHCKF